MVIEAYRSESCCAKAMILKHLFIVFRHNLLGASLHQVGESDCYGGWGCQSNAYCETQQIIVHFNAVKDAEAFGALTMSV